jgi:hypothetical protein
MTNTNHFQLSTSKTECSLGHLLHPAQAFQHPSAVVADQDLTLNEKRAILAAWASDACAIASPALRSNGSVTVPIDDIFEALSELDRQARVEQPGGWATRQIRRQNIERWRQSKNTPNLENGGRHAL